VKVFRTKFWRNNQEFLIDHKTRDESWHWINQNEKTLDHYQVRELEVSDFHAEVIGCEGWWVVNKLS